MNCQDLDPLLYPYLDGELLPVEKLEIDAHLGGCTGCAAKVDLERRSLEVIRGAARAHSPCAPPHLKDNLLAGIRVEQRRQRRVRFLKLSAAAAGVAICAVAANTQWRSFQRRQMIEDAALRYARQYPYEISKATPEQLAIWFDGKLDHRVAVPRFPHATAVGARLLNVRERQAAYIGYDVRGAQRPGRAGLFVFGGGDDLALETEFGSSNGYNVVTWRDGNLEYVLVTDSDAEDVRQLLPEAPVGALPTIDARPASFQQ